MTRKLSAVENILYALYLSAVLCSVKQARNLGWYFVVDDITVRLKHLFLQTQSLVKTMQEARAVLGKNIWGGGWPLIIWKATTAKRNYYRTNYINQKQNYCVGVQLSGQY